MMQYRALDWDSDFFGIKVVQIIPPQLSARELADLLAELKSRQAGLVYWPADREWDEAVIKSLRGNLTDRKTTFAIRFGSAHPDGIVSADIVEPFTDAMPVADLEGLAIQSGGYSRFAIDPKLPRERFIALYKLWMIRSLRKEIADEVLVIREGGRVVGMVTLGEKQGRGDIGLIAVDRAFRRTGHGEKLMRAAHTWFTAHGYDYGQVITQGRNTPACNLYTKCGYSVERVEYFYHFWL